MKYRVLCHILVFFMCLSGLAAQTHDSTQILSRTARNVVFVEGLGNGIVYSVNYERFLSDVISLRVGFSWLPVTVFSTSQERSILPISVNYFLGQGEHRCELGVGLTVMYSIRRYRPDPMIPIIPDDPSFYLQAYPTARLGYRFQPMNGGFVFGVTFTPILVLDTPYTTFQPWGGISLGWGF